MDPFFYCISTEMTLYQRDRIVIVQLDWPDQSLTVLRIAHFIPINHSAVLYAFRVKSFK